MTTAYEHKTQLVGDDYHGLPTQPVKYRGARKGSSVDWDQITADYVARGGQVDASVWPNHGKVVVIGGSANSSKANIHTFIEAEEYDEPTPAIPNRAPRPQLERSKINSEQRAAVARRWRDGDSVLQLARSYGVAPKTIYGALAMAGVDLEERRPQRTNSRLTDEQRDEIRRLRADGATLAFLAREYGVSVTTIAKTTSTGMPS